MIKISSGVFRLPGEESGPETLKFEGEQLFRFMDFFYIRTPHLDDLTPEEVSNLCRARASYPSLISPANSGVQALFRDLIGEIKPKSLLEIGAGTRPILESALTGVSCVLADADQSVVLENVSVGRECYFFAGSGCSLPHGNNHFDMVLAVFVLQFKFYKNQIEELYRCLSPSGVFVANVYRRTEESRARLSNDFQSAGFNLRVLPDSKRLCRGNEYWVVGKDLNAIDRHLCALDRFILSSAMG